MQKPMPKSVHSDSKSPTLWIDFRHGNAVMQLESGEEVHWVLPMNSADRSQCNTPSGWCSLEPKISSGLQPELEG